MQGWEEFQLLFNLTVGAAGVVGGWLLRTATKTISDLQAQDKELTRELNLIKVLVAGDYVKKEEFVRRLDSLEHRLFEKLDAIDHKINGKMDK